MRSELKLPRETNNTKANVAAVFQVVSSENFPSQTIDVWNIDNFTTLQGYHVAVGPAPDTSEPSFVVYVRWFMFFQVPCRLQKYRLVMLNDKLSN